MTEKWTPPEALVERVADDISNLFEGTCTHQEARSIALSALAATPLAELVEALERLYRDLDRDISIGTLRKNINAALARAKGDQP